jgi:trehalose 6-phosphate synthase
MDDISVVLASNRGPVSFTEGPDGFETKRGAGGLSGAVDPVARRLGERAVWICATNSDVDRAAAEDPDVVDRAGAELGYGLRMIDIPHETYARYYDVVSNRMLWFANHCLWDELDIHDFGADELAAWSEAYEPVNRRFAEEIAAVGDDRSLVLVQDYHLATTPRHLRELHPNQTILHFTHSSFCGPKGLAPLPDPLPRNIIEGMLGADLVGFHVHSWASGFMDCCEDIGAKVERDAGRVTHDGRTSWVRTYPIPVDPASLRERSQNASAQHWKERFANFRPDGGALIIRADRAEPSKNIVRGFEAYGMLLDRRPELLASTRFAACVYPSRASMPEYQRYMESIKEVVDQVDRRHPDAIHLFMEDDFDRTLAALTEYDILLVNPIMDGMNLVSKEGPCLNEHDGVLVLSTGAGSFEELGDHAIPLEDPLDVEETSRQLELALSLSPDERKRRASALRDAAQARKPGDWIGPQLEDLRAIRSSGEPVTSL